MENEKHIINISIPELDFNRYMNLIAYYGFSRGGLTKDDANTFKKLANIFSATLEEIK